MHPKLSFGLVRNNYSVVHSLYLSYHIVQIRIQLIQRAALSACESVFLYRQKRFSQPQHFLSAVKCFNIHDHQISLTVFGKEHRRSSFSAHVRIM